jgi:hypothetical protein
MEGGRVTTLRKADVLRDARAMAERVKAAVSQAAAGATNAK